MKGVVRHEAEYLFDPGISHRLPAVIQLLEAGSRWLIRFEVRSPMEHIWSPWRYTYISAAGGDGGCVFCRVQRPAGDSAQADRENLVLYRGEFNFIILNLFPYTSGHLMVVPYEHTAELTSLEAAVTTEMIELAKRSQTALAEEYKPHGFNIGMNLGSSAGAGVADHLHLHVVPRWSGDANFMSVVGETRVLPEDLPTTYARLKKHFPPTAAKTP